MSPRPILDLVAGSIAVVFGLLSLVSGGLVLLDEAAARAAGAAVPFVLWFNVATAPLYVAAGIGLLRWRRWAAPLSLLLAAAITLVLLAFAVHVLGGGAWEPRTLAALLLRCLLWIAIALLARRIPADRNQP